MSFVNRLCKSWIYFVVYFMPMSISSLYSVQWLDDTMNRIWRETVVANSRYYPGNLPRGAEKEQKKNSHSGYWVSWPRREPWTSRIQVQSITAAVISSIKAGWSIALVSMLSDLFRSVVVARSLCNIDLFLSNWRTLNWTSFIHRMRLNMIVNDEFIWKNMGQAISR